MINNPKMADTGLYIINDSLDRFSGKKENILASCTSKMCPVLESGSKIRIHFCPNLLRLTRKISNKLIFNEICVLVPKKLKIGHKSIPKSAMKLVSSIFHGFTCWYTIHKQCNIGNSIQNHTEAKKNTKLSSIGIS